MQLAKVSLSLESSFLVFGKVLSSFFRFRVRSE